ncbi:MAG: DUF1957 domain-containing protein, partial [Spirochaetales bacterium]|nr:DUF1957 domain-containing protein [Spirochaetales bacterium]
QDLPEAVSAQIQVAMESHHRHFSRLPRGVWIPECAYYPGLETFLKRNKIEYFFSASHGVLFGKDYPVRGVFAPVSLSNGVLVFPRDLLSTNAVWSRDRGYPSDPVYRDFYRDIGFDLDLPYLEAYLQGSNNRFATGFKYHAVTGATDSKVLYDPDAATARVTEHARSFLEARIRHARTLVEAGFDRIPLVTAPFNAELFGHWWFEGPQWIDRLFREAVQKTEVGFVTPSDVLLDQTDFQKTEIPFSSWATGGYAEVWVDGSNDWILRHTHKMVERMVELANRFPDVQGRKERALNQAAREVLLAEASDWPLILKMGTTVGYAERRINEHISNFTRIYEALSSNSVDTEWLTSLEKRNNVFPFLNYRIFCKS